MVKLSLSWGRAVAQQNMLKAALSAVQAFIGFQKTGFVMLG
jgi:hypothetical protein